MKGLSFFVILAKADLVFSLFVGYSNELNEVLETKRPLTRSVLEKRIAVAEEKVAEALARKEYEACAPLQKKVDELIRELAAQGR